MLSVLRGVLAGLPSSSMTKLKTGWQQAMPLLRHLLRRSDGLDGDCIGAVLVGRLFLALHGIYG